MRCSSSDRVGPALLVSANGGVYSFYFGFIGILIIALSGASEILIFEIMLLSSTHVDCCIPNPTSFSHLKWFLSYLIIFFTSYFCFTSSAILFAVTSHESIDSSQTFSKQAAAIILNNVLSLAGAAYFLWTLHFNSFAYGRHSILSLQEHNMSNAKKIASMKFVTMSQLAISMKAFFASWEIAKRKVADDKCSREQLDTLVERLCSPPHMLAACMQLTPENVVAIHAASIHSSCCRSLRLAWLDVDYLNFSRFLCTSPSLLFLHHRFVNQ